MVRAKQPTRRKADLRPEQMRTALRRLRKRIEELDGFPVGEVNDRRDPRIRALEDRIRATIGDAFDPDTYEFAQFDHIRLDRAPMNAMYETPLGEVRDGLRRGIAEAKANLGTIVTLLEEKLGDESQDITNRARRAFSQLDLHPEIARAVTKLFEDGHYANAVEDGCKVLDLLVKLRSGRADLSGTTLMQTVFGQKRPVLRFNALANESEESEQQGLMFLYAGAMLAFRNPRAHGMIHDSADNALDYIAFLSLLAKTLDKASKV